METFERLLDIGNFGLVEEIEFQVLEAEYGDGYDDSALVGSSEGTRSWKLSYKVLPGSIGNVQGGVFSAQSRADWLWDFFVRHKAAGNKSFIINSPRDGRDYLAKFAEHKLSYEIFMTRLYSTGIQLKQRRERG
jgi:phage-related protein